jgi:multiple sugar transport system substrate-binding protein
MTRWSNHKTTWRLGIGLVATGMVTLAGCAGAPAPNSTSATTGAAVVAGQCPASDGPVTLNYWSWGAGYEDAAKLWNSTHPDIQVTYSDIPVGNSGGYQKMFNAVKAGTAPDIGFLEFDNIAAFGSQDYLADVSGYVTDAQKADFVAPVKKAVSLGTDGAMFSVPIGGGPMALIYRKDLFTKHGIDVPTTWAEFEQAAAKVHKADPSAVLANFDGYGNANWFAGLSSQNKAQWFAPDGDGWKVSVNDAASKATADLWQRMLDAKSASDLATFSPAWSSALAKGKIWSWPTAVWGAGVVKSSAPDTSGDWAVAPLPTWNAGEKVSATWGGGGLSVFKTSKHPCEAAQFALWMGTSPDALKILNKAIGIYPTTNTLLADPLFSEPDKFFGDQKIFDVFRAASEVTPDFTWGPSMTDTYKAITDAFTNAKTAKSSLSAALDEAQTAVVSSMQKDGFTVSQ